MAEDRLILGRRALFDALGAVLALGCGAALLSACGAAPEVRAVTPPPLLVPELAALIPRPGLSWALVCKPRDIAQIPWLIPVIGKLVPEPNFAAFKQQTGFDLRQLHEAIVMGFAEGGERAAIIRHNEKPGELEAKFRTRLSADLVRSEDRPDLVRIRGKVGRQTRAFARLGADVAVYQDGGDPERGAARIAALYAQDKLKAPRALQVPPLSDLLTRFGKVPLSVVALGPFAPEWHRGARGLLQVATALGAAVRPTARENLGVSLALSGEFGDRGSDAADTLREAYDDLAATSSGRLFGLAQPVERPVVAGDREVVTLSVELEPARVAEALVAMLSEDIAALMRID